MYPGASFGGDEAAPEPTLEAAGGDQGGDVVWELDAGGDEPTAGAPGAAAGGLPSAAPPELTPYEQRVAALERQNAELTAQLTPYLAHLRAQREFEQSRPPIDVSRIDDPNSGIKPSDLVKLMDWQRQRDLEQLRAHSQFTAQATLSEQEARGRFTAEALGAGNDYDTVVSQYVAPLVSQNPAIDQLIQMAAPGNPAAGRMIFGAIVAAINRRNGDVVGGLKAVFNGLGAYQDGAQATTRALSNAARAQAARVVPASQAGARSRRVAATEADVWKMSDRQFSKMWDNLGR